ncbi:MAG TPA: serine/threonine-protein kinase [Kofleriaceae bacterium]|nr:serine/threonine-protein kinase [Kofleriaceae bacterium]
MRVCSRCWQLVPASAPVCPHDGAAVTDTPTLPAGTMINGYRIVRLLGEGGMGYVYEAVHEVLRRRTAMKFLRPEFAAEPEVIARFTQEAQAVNLVQHEHIVNVYDIGDAADGSVYFVMEYLEGQDLSDLQAGRGLELPLLVHIYAQVLRALVAAHGKQLVHRDLKPANVFITKREGNPFFVKLLDFGIAKLRDGTSKALTREGAVMGTPSYMSPEQIQGKAVDHRSDLFTIGIMLYRAATGLAPFRGESFGELAASILASEPPPIREAAPAVNLPASLERVVQRALKKKVDERYQSAAEMLLDLENVRREAGLDAAALDHAVAGIAGVPVADMATRVPVAGTRPSLGESLPVFQGVPEKLAGSVATAPKSKTGLVAAVGVSAVAIAVILVVVVMGSGGTSSATAPAAASAGTAPATGAATASDATGSAAEGDTFVALRARGDAAAVHAAAEARLSGGLQGDAATQANVVAALELAGSPRAAPLLYRALGGGPDVRVRAARALRALAIPEAAPKLRAVMSGSGDKVRVEIAAAMAVLGDADAAKLLESALADEQTGLTAAAALAEIGTSEPARARLAAIYADTPRGRDRWRIAAEGLARMGDAPARKSLVEELAQADAKRAVAAATALVHLGDDAGRGYLERVVADATFVARPAAALALADSDGAGALAFVADGLASTDADTRMVAIAVVARLGASLGGQAAKHLDAVARLADTDPDPRVRIVAQAALWVAEA